METISDGYSPRQPVQDSQRGARLLISSFFAGPGQRDGVQVVALDREADVLARVAQVVLLVEITPGRQPGRPLAGDDPGGRAVDGLAVDPQPLAHAQQQLLWPRPGSCRRASGRH